MSWEAVDPDVTNKLVLPMSRHCAAVIASRGSCVKCKTSTTLSSEFVLQHRKIY